MLECVVNIAEGRDRATIEALTVAAGECLLDVHVDASHHRSVFTLAGDNVETATRRPREERGRESISRTIKARTRASASSTSSPSSHSDPTG